MNEHDDRWAAVGREVRARYEELRWPRNELIRRSGVSEPIVRGIVRGGPFKRGPGVPVQHKIEEALGWESGSILAILEGGSPRVLADPVSPRGSLEDLAERVAVLESLVDDVSRQLEQVVHLAPEARGRSGEAARG